MVAREVAVAGIRAFRNPLPIYQEPFLVLELAQDFRDLLIELADADADFVIIGGYAVAFHGHPRATKDLDVLVRATPPNAQKVTELLRPSALRLNDFRSPPRIFQIMTAFYRSVCRRAASISLTMHRV